MAKGTRTPISETVANTEATSQFYRDIRDYKTLCNQETGKSADCQWSRHILCLAPRVCECRCHRDG